MKKKRTFRWLFLVGILFLIGLPRSVFADEGNVGFTVTPHLQENQRKTGNSFFDLLAKPNQEIDLSYDIVNSSDKEQTFDIGVNPAYTNDSGQIDYVDKDHKRDDTLKVDLAKIATYEDKVTVGAGETKTMTVKLNMPAEAFKGELLGGIHVARETADGEQKGAQLVNRFAYVIGLRLVEDETEVKRDLKMLDAKPGLSYHHTAVKALMQNPEPTEMGKLKFDAKVRKKGSSEVLRTSESKDLSMAPNSSFEYVVDWGDKALEAGDYNLALSVTDAKGNKWDFDQDFTIKEKEAKEYNASAVKVAKKTTSPWLYALIGFLLAVIIGLIIFLILSRRKKKQEEE